MNLDIQTNYEEPRNEMERTIVDVWEEVLDIKGIGINTNFFEAGGDSIKALQIVSKLGKENFKVEIKDIFEKLKIKEISKYVKLESKKEIDNGPVEGRVELTPIQLKYFDDNNEDFNHFNQSFMLYKKEGFNENIIKDVFNNIVEHHDALRMIYTKTDGQIIQYNRGLGEKVFDLYVRDFIEEKNLEENIYNAATEIQKELSVLDGNLIKICIFRTSEGDHLLIVIHHLVVDGVSWRILFEDIKSLYKQASEGENLDLGYKFSSYKDYALKLKEYSNSNSLLKEQSYWSRVSNSKVKFIGKNSALSVGKYGDSKTLSILLDKDETNKLLRQTNKAYNTQINDILLTALLLTTRSITGENKLKVSMEGHGREDVLKDIDVSRTVGWFTSMYPVYIDLGEDIEISKNIKMVKETLRKIPNKGVGYGILNYLSKDTLLENEEKPEILFNYLGEMDNSLDKEEFSISKFDSGKSIGSRIRRNTFLEIDSILVNGQLIISTTFNRNQYDDFTIKEMNTKFKENLEIIIDHCINKEQSEKTASDYGAGNISSDDLDNILSDYE
jgi:non-ribosomal peptide synthase protein (TIGR01720 family)